MEGKCFIQVGALGIQGRRGKKTTQVSGIIFVFCFSGTVQVEWTNIIYQCVAYKVHFFLQKIASPYYTGIPIAIMHYVAVL